MYMTHQVNPVEPTPKSNVVIVTTTSDNDFDNPPPNVIYVRPGYTPED